MLLAVGLPIFQPFPRTRPVDGASLSNGNLRPLDLSTHTRSKRMRDDSLLYAVSNGKHLKTL